MSTESGVKPKYPIYIPSHGRSESMLLPPLLKEWKVPFHLVVDESQWDLYRAKGYEEYMLKLPFLNNGTSFPPRVFINEHSKANGDKRHWQVDDNIRCFRRYDGARRIKIDPGLGLRMIENFCGWSNDRGKQDREDHLIDKSWKLFEI